MGDVTIGANTVTVFGTQSLAIIYMKTQLEGTVFHTAANSNQKLAMVSATRWMTRLGLVDPDTGLDILPDTPDTSPLAVQEGAYELALVLLNDAEAASNKTTGSNNKKIKAGSAELEFFRPTEGSILPTTALQLLAPYITSQTPVSLLTGSFLSEGGVSEFCDPDQGFGLNGGYS